MDRIVSDRAVKIIVLIIGIILVIDLVNVFIVGGPSGFSLIANSGSPASASKIPGNASGQPGVMVTGTQNAAGSPASVQAIYVPTKATAVPTIQYVTEVTPIPEVTTTTVRRFAQPPTQVTQEEEDYALIYTRDLSYLPSNLPTAVAVNVVNPPLVIKFTVSPVMTSHQSVSVNRSAKKSGPSSTDIVVNATFPSEDARFTAIVYDKETGQKLYEEGYGGLHDQIEDNTLMVRKAGNYLIQFDGAQSTVHVVMLLKKEGNIA